MSIHNHLIRRPQPSVVLKRQGVQRPLAPAVPRWPRLSSRQLLLAGAACLVLGISLVVNYQTVQTNHTAARAVAALAHAGQHQTSEAAGATTSSSTTAPSTIKPSQRAFDQYVVAADLARYVQIPKLGVNARVLQVGVDTTGTMAAPGNVFDTGWYTASAKPGQPGATVIDGHVSSWSTNGVFYGLKTLKAGDALQIVRGDGSVLNYQVVTSKVYDADKVDMQAALSPITAGKSGLNLITCTGKVKPGTSEFEQRLVVFAQLKA